MNECDDFFIYQKGFGYGFGKAMMDYDRRCAMTFYQLSSKKAKEEPYYELMFNRGQIEGMKMARD